MMTSNGWLVVQSWILVLVVVGNSNKGWREMVLVLEVKKEWEKKHKKNERERERERERGEKRREWRSMLGKGLGWWWVKEEELATREMKSEERGAMYKIEKWGEKEKKRKEKENIKIFWPVWMQHNIYIYIYTFELQCTTIFDCAFLQKKKIFSYAL